MAAMVNNLFGRTWRRSWPLAVWLLMALSLGALSACQADRPNTVGIGQAKIAPGQRALVPITVTNVTSPRGLGGYDLRITFDPAVVKIVSVVGGDPPFGSVVASNINNTEGWVMMVSVQGGTLNGPRGPITVAYLEMEAIGARGAVTPLGLQVNEMFDTDADPIGATAVNGEVRVR